jgi:ABC-type amino acid transport system permease subunit
VTTLGVDPIVRAALRAALALLFGWAAAHKLRDLAAFRTAVSAYALVPGNALSVVSALAVGTEIGVAVTLTWPASGSLPAVGAALLLLTYAAAVAVNLLRGRDHIDCGCAGAAGRRSISGSLVARNLVLGAAALVAAPPATSRQLVWIDAVTLVAAVGALALLYAAADGLVAHGSQLARLVADRHTADHVEGAHG